MQSFVALTIKSISNISVLWQDNNINQLKTNIIFTQRQCPLRVDANIKAMLEAKKQQG